MSNPTELPDLDRGYFKRKLATIVRDLSSYNAQEMARELVRLAKVADESEAVKEARCAQPEGEAPQDAALFRLICSAADDDSSESKAIEHLANIDFLGDCPASPDVVRQVAIEALRLVKEHPDGNFA